MSLTGENGVVGRDSWSPRGRDWELPERRYQRAGQPGSAPGKQVPRGAEGRLTKGEGPIQAHRAGEAVSHLPQWRGSAWSIAIRILDIY